MIASQYRIVTNAPARRVIEGGREWLVAPLASINPGVLPGSRGRLYYPPEECGRNVADWDGIPITDGHPIDPLGRHVSAGSPGILDRQGLGVIRGSSFDGKLRHEAWFDAERTRIVNPRIHSNLLTGTPTEV